MPMRVVVVAVVLTLSGFPLGSLLCGEACAPAGAAAPLDCHGHGDTTAGAPAVSGLHLCDQDSSVAPMVIQPAFALTSAPVDLPSVVGAKVGQGFVRHIAWVFPPGQSGSPGPAAAAPLRI